MILKCVSLSNDYVILAVRGYECPSSANTIASYPYWECDIGARWCQCGDGAIVGYPITCDASNAFSGGSPVHSIDIYHCNGWSRCLHCFSGHTLDAPDLVPCSECKPGYMGLPYCSEGNVQELTIY